MSSLVESVNSSAAGRWQIFSLIEFTPAIKKIEASALYDDGLLGNSYLNKFNASEELLILETITNEQLVLEQLKTPNTLHGNAGMSFITNKLESLLNLQDLE